MPAQLPVVRRHTYARASAPRRHRHTYWHCDQVLSGGGTLESALANQPQELRTQKVRAGDWWLVPAGCLHAWRYQAGTSLCSIRFLAAAPLLRPWRVVDAPARALAAALPELVAGTAWRRTATAIAIQHCMEAIIALATDELGDGERLRTPGREPGLANRIKEAAKAARGQRVGVAQLAAELHMSARSLRRSFSAETGQRLKDWLDDERTRHIEALLLAGLPVATIALRLGFSHPSDCSRLFRRTRGCSPRVWLQRGC